MDFCQTTHLASHKICRHCTRNDGVWGLEIYCHSFWASALDGTSGQLHTSPALPRGKSPRYPLNRRLGGPQSRSERFGEEKNLLPVPTVESQSPHRLSCGLVVDRLHCPGSNTFQERQFLFYFPQKTLYDFLKFAIEYRLCCIPWIRSKAKVQEYHLIMTTRRRGTVIIVLGLSRIVVGTPETKVNNSVFSIERQRLLLLNRT
jgi:hypothetical protein